MSSSAVLNMDSAVVVDSGGSSSSQQQQQQQAAVVASATIYVQDLVNEMTQTVLHQSSSSAAAAAAVAAAISGSANSATTPASSASINILNDDNSNGSNSSNSVSATIVLPSTATTTTNKRLNDSDVKSSAKSSKRSKTGGKILSESESLIKQKLESRLGGILCCAVCLELPKSSVYQCANGHLMCAGCFTHLLADARIRDETATCPNCRCVISKDACSRNLAVEKAVCELPGECRFCNRELPRSMLDKHMADICEERIVSCRYAPIGCPWNGPSHETDFHAESCSHPSKSGKEVLSFLGSQEKSAKEEKKIYDSLFNLLSFEKITLNDLQFRPYRTDEYIHKLFYETARFSAFNLQWVVKARVNDDQRDPTQSCERQISFQISLKTKLSTPMTIHYMLLKGPFGDMKILPKLYKHDFVESSTDTAYNKVNLVNSAECNRLLAAKVINFRLIMFMATK